MGHIHMEDVVGDGEMRVVKHIVSPYITLFTIVAAASTKATIATFAMPSTVSFALVVYMYVSGSEMHLFIIQTAKQR